MDLIAGDTAGNVTLFRNIGTPGKPELAKGVLVEADGKPITATRQTYKIVSGKAVMDKAITGSHKLAETYSKIHMADWDGDGLKDLLVGHSTTVILYKNVGTPSAPRFQSPIEIKIPEGNFPSRPSPYVVDWDGDGKKDLLVGCESSQVIFYRNIGTDKAPRLDRGKDLGLKVPKSEAGYRWRIDVADWNNDGKRDILVGNFYSGGSRKAGGNIWLFLAK
jgi:hypothetical protein